MEKNNLLFNRNHVHHFKQWEKHLLKERLNVGTGLQLSTGLWLCTGVHRDRRQ